MLKNEAHSSLTGKVNSKNWKDWEVNDPHDVVAIPLQGGHVTVCCGITSTFNVGSYIFEQDTAADLQPCKVLTAR